LRVNLNGVDPIVDLFPIVPHEAAVGVNCYGCMVPHTKGDRIELIRVRIEIESNGSHRKWAVRIRLLLTRPLHFFRNVTGSRTGTRKQGGYDDDSDACCSHLPGPGRDCTAGRSSRTINHTTAKIVGR
jgi:hypothetical protein